VIAAGFDGGMPRRRGAQQAGAVGQGTAGSGGRPSPLPGAPAYGQPQRPGESARPEPSPLSNGGERPASGASSGNAGQPGSMRAPASGPAAGRTGHSHDEEPAPAQRSDLAAQTRELRERLLGNRQQFHPSRPADQPGSDTPPPSQPAQPQPARPQPAPSQPGDTGGGGKPFTPSPVRRPVADDDDLDIPDFLK
jgi:cell division protein FtsZ